jgi:hypothetical protein
MAAYRNADLVWAVTDSDRGALLNEEANLHIGVIPNVHSLPIAASGENVTRDSHQLIFIGSFAHEPNVDAILYFCQEILPCIRNSVPNVKLNIVGNAPDTTTWNPARYQWHHCVSAPGSNDIWGGVASRDARLTGKHAGFDRAG